MIFLRHELFWFCLVQVSATQFVFFFPPASMAHIDDASDRPVPESPVQFTTSNVGSPDGSGSDLDGMGTRPGITGDEKLDAILSKFVHCEAQLAQILTLTNWMSRMESHVAKTLGGFVARLTEMEQNFSAFTARMCKIETGVTSAPSVSGYPSGSRRPPGQIDRSTATASRDRGPSEEGRKTRRRLDKDTSPDDENARSAVLLRYPCEQCHAAMSAWLARTLGPTDQPERVHCKTRTTSARLVFETRAKCQDLWCDFRMMAFHSRSTVPFATPRARFLFVNPGHQNTERRSTFFAALASLGYKVK